MAHMSFDRASIAKGIALDTDRVRFDVYSLCNNACTAAASVLNNPALTIGATARMPAPAAASAADTA